MAAIAVGLHFKDVGALARTGMLDGASARFAHGANIHAVHLLAGNAEGDAALGKIRLRRGAGHRGAHRIAVFSIT